MHAGGGYIARLRGAQSPESGEPRSCQVEVDYFETSNHINADGSTKEDITWYRTGHGANPAQEVARPYACTAFRMTIVHTYPHLKAQDWSLERPITRLGLGKSPQQKHW